MFLSGPFLLFYSPFVVAVFVLIWANIPRKDVEEVGEVEEHNELVDRIDKTTRNRSDVMSRKPYAF